MTNISISLSEERLAQLRALAERNGVSPEEFLNRRVDHFLASTETEFCEAADFVLRKNAELYRRLA